MNGKCAWTMLAVLISSSTCLSAGSLAEPEKAYVTLVTLAIGVTNMCDEYDVDDMAILKFTAARAVDVERLGPATLNALEAVVGTDYDRGALIPEVTSIVRSVSDRMTRDVSKSGRALVCDRYAKKLIAVGFLRTK
jgi:hypothetical protein